MTPQAISKEYGNKILWRRWFGAWVDFITLFAILFAGDFILGSELYQESLSIWTGLVLAYFPVLEGLTGRTLGKLISGTIVVNARGQTPGLIRASVRSLLRILEVNPLLFAGLPAGVAVLASESKQRLGDLVARTWVIPVKYRAQVSSSADLDVYRQTV